MNYVTPEVKLQSPFNCMDMQQVYCTLYIHDRVALGSWMEIVI